MNCLVFGAGAIGTYVGGSLALNGNRVVFLERADVAKEIKSRGLRLNLYGHEAVVREPWLAGSLEEAFSQGPYDAAIFAIKSNDTQSAITQIAPFASKMPTLLCLQNGVDNEPALAAVLGTQRVIAGSVTSAIWRRAAGDIVLEKRRGIGIADGNPLSTLLANALIQAGLNVRLYSKAADMKWSKMLTNLLGNATSAILDMAPAEIFAHPGLYRLELEQIREALRVMKAQGISVISLPGVPVPALAFAVTSLPDFVSRPFLQKMVGAGRGGKMPSLQIDLHSHKGSSEVDYLNGSIVRHGERLGIPTPVNQLLNQTLLKLTRGEIPLDTYVHKPDKFVSELSN